MSAQSQIDQDNDIAAGVDAEIFAANQRKPVGQIGAVMAALCVAYTAFHIGAMNLYPLETWTYRLLHVGGGLVIGFLLFSSLSFSAQEPANQKGRTALILPGLALIALALGQVLLPWLGIGGGVDQAAPATSWRWTFGAPLALGTVWVMVIGWRFPDQRRAQLVFAA